MSTKRQSIESLRNKIRERNADSNYSNQFLFQTLMEMAKWLITREITAGRIYKNTWFFQILKCQRVVEVSPIDPCCPVKTKCKVYRTECKLPDVWIDKNGPVIKNVTSVDGSTEFFITTPTAWQNKKNDPYQKMVSGLYYTFFSDGYFWFPEVNPHRVNINGFWVDDITDFNQCGETDCVPYLDTPFWIPDWIEGEMMAKAVELLAGVSKRLPEDEQIDKNATRRS